MPAFTLRRNSVVPAYPNEFVVILTMDDGYELEVGHIAERTGSNNWVYWAWACPRANGREPTRDEAMAAFKAAWRDPDLAKMRREQEWTENKYALFDAGYRDQIARGEIRCPCGATFNPRSHEEMMAHIEHIKATRS